ncbi:ANTAR domain-containing protein [Rhodococcus sp. 24CO]|uniref:ANTAR domain-containing protein n=1 Tax=Rhodococcus sp. 24CO TaxID=3117460 RepID=UPI003D341004
MAGITLLSESGVPRTAVSTSSTVRDVDFEQYGCGEGPCLEAARTRRMVRATVTDSAFRWPVFSAHLREPRVRSFLSSPLWVDERHAGALNIYGHHARGFSEVDALIVCVYTTAIEGLFRIAKEIEFAQNEITGLNTAMKSRATIEQAKGILMAIRGCSSEAAFQVLVTESQRTQQKLRVIADQIVERAESSRANTKKTT